MLQSGQGAWLTDARGNQLLDAFAGLWCVNVGYGQESVVQAAAEQMRRLPYATGYFHFSSEPAIRLAEKLVQITPDSLNHVYLTLGGSESIDAATRFIVQYYNAIGKPAKKHCISLERGYHGSSSTGAGLTALPAFHRGFDLPLKTQHYIPSPNPTARPIRRTARPSSRHRSRRCAPRWPNSAPRTSPPSSANPSRVPAASSCHRWAGSRPCARPPASWTYCWWSMRSSPASAAPAPCSPARPKASRPTS